MIPENQLYGPSKFVGERSNSLGGYAGSASAGSLAQGMAANLSKAANSAASAKPNANNRILSDKSVFNQQH